jgi:hypothetical protein
VYFGGALTNVGMHGAEKPLDRSTCELFALDLGVP